MHAQQRAKQAALGRPKATTVQRAGPLNRMHESARTAAEGSRTRTGRGERKRATYGKLRSARARPKRNSTNEACQRQLERSSSTIHPNSVKTTFQTETSYSMAVDRRSELYGMTARRAQAQKCHPKMLHPESYAEKCKVFNRCVAAASESGARSASSIIRLLTFSGRSARTVNEATSCM